MATISIEELYNHSRFPRVGVALLYIPFGILLVLLRFIILSFALLLYSVLPSNDFCKSVHQKLLCIAFGITINTEGIERLSEDIDSVICNKISIFDCFVANIVLKAVMPINSKDTQFSKLIGRKHFGPLNNSDTLRNNIALYTANTKTAVLVQPELMATNGRGLLKFSANQFAMCNKVQPVLLQTERPILDVAVTTIDSTFWVDAFFYMYSPLTIYNVVLLPVAEKKTFADADFAAKLQNDMAKSLKVVATEHTAGDMREYQKRYFVEQQRMQSQSQRPNVGVNPELQRMANQVKEVLPMVPKNVIIKDLARTWNVDMTITNILEGSVPYTPEPVPLARASPSTSGVRASTSSSQASSCSMAPSESLAKSFGKSANDRMMSFQKRKAELIATARQKYIEKHGLNVALNNC